MFVGELTQGQVTRLWQINLVRRLDNPDGTFAGVIAASYNTNSFSRFYREVDLGAHGIIAVVSSATGTPGHWLAPTKIRDGDQHCQVTACCGDAAIGRGKLDRGVGSGRWRPNVCLRRGSRSNLKVVVGIDRGRGAARRPRTGSMNALLFAGGITLLIAGAGLLLLRAQTAARRRHEIART